MLSPHLHFNQNNWTFMEFEEDIVEKKQHIRPTRHFIRNVYILNLFFYFVSFYWNFSTRTCFYWKRHGVTLLENDLKQYSTSQEREFSKKHCWVLSWLNVIFFFNSPGNNAMVNLPTSQLNSCSLKVQIYYFNCLYIK